MKLYAVMVGGPTLAGYVALCTEEKYAAELAFSINRENALSPTATKSPDTGLSKAWEMGDGKATVVMLTVPDESAFAKFFEWD